MSSALVIVSDVDDAIARHLAERRMRAARLEEAQRQAFYGSLYAALAAYHLTEGGGVARARACLHDAARCHAFAVAVVLGPGPES